MLGLKINETLIEREVKVRAEILHEEKSQINNNGDEVKNHEKISESGETLVTFLDQSLTLSFGQFTPHFFRPGLSYIGQVRE